MAVIHQDRKEVRIKTVINVNLGILIRLILSLRNVQHVIYHVVRATVLRIPNVQFVTMLDTIWMCSLMEQTIPIQPAMIHVLTDNGEMKMMVRIPYASFVIHHAYYVMEDLILSVIHVPMVTT